MRPMQQSGVNFTAVQFKWLKQRAKELGVSLAEVVRRIVDEKRESTRD